MPVPLGGSRCSRSVRARARLKGLAPAMLRSPVPPGSGRAFRSAAVGVLAALGCTLFPLAVAGAVPAATTTGSSRSAIPESGSRPQPASKGATFGIGPSNSTGLDGRPYLNFLVQPGSTVNDHAELINLASRPMTLNVYVVSASTSTDGKLGYLARGSKVKDVASWMKLGVPANGATVTLGPRSRRIIPILLAVPRTAAPGDYAAGVIASLTSKVTSRNGTNANFEQRVALRTFVRVGGPLHPRLAVQHLSAGYDGSADPFGSGSVVISYTVRNNGNVRLGAHQKVTVSGLFGSDSPARALPDVPLLLPGSSIRMTVTVPGVLPQVRLTARVALYPLALTGDVDPAAPKQVSVATGLWAVPWVLIALLVVLVGVGIGYWRWRRRRARRPPPGGSHRKRGGPTSPDDSGDSAKVSASSKEGV